MAMSFAPDIAQTSLDAVKARFNGGTVRVYGPAEPGGPVPGDIDAPLGGAILLAEMVLANPAFGAVTFDGDDAICTSPAAVQDPQANDTGLATVFRLFNAAGELKGHGSVGVPGSDEDMIMTQPNLVENGPVAISAIILRQARK